MTSTETKTDKMSTEPNLSMFLYVSLGSINTSAQFCVSRLSGSVLDSVSGRVNTPLILVSAIMIEGHV